MTVAHATVWIEAALVAVPGGVVLASVVRSLHARRHESSSVQHKESTP